METVEMVVFYVIVGIVLVVSILYVLGNFILFCKVFKNLENLENYIKDTEKYVKEKIDEVLK